MSVLSSASVFVYLAVLSLQAYLLVADLIDVEASHSDKTAGTEGYK